MNKVIIVAEVGQNHNGSLETALKMVEAAKACDVDAVKFQRRYPSIAVPEYMKQQSKETPWGTMSYLEYRNRLELPLSAYGVIDSACKRIGLPWFSSVWDLPSLEDMKRFDMPYIKIPSACLTDHELIMAAKATGKPVILSTGMSTMSEIRQAAGLLNRSDVLCHCNSTYPCPNEALNLRCIATFKFLFRHLSIGYSGHEVGLAPTLAAVALGAVYVERHFTLDRSMWGTDQAASVEPGGFRRLVKDIRVIEQALGDGDKRVTPGELEAMRKLRRVNSSA